jgi:hypothetical protein
MINTKEVVAAQELYKTRVASIERENTRWVAEIERNFANDPAVCNQQLAVIKDLRTLSLQIALEERDNVLDKLVSEGL